MSSHSAKTSVAIFICLIIWRTINGLSIQTFFQPDEYFQSLEPAWQAAFGPGSGAWITWEWREQLRSSFHPLIFAAAYRLTAWLCEAFGLSPTLRAELLLATPKLVQAVFAACGDFYCWRLASRLYGRNSNASWAALGLTVLSPWQWFCSTRTFSNSLETTLTALALSYWPWEWIRSDATDGKPKKTQINTPGFNLNLALFSAATACILRPTNIIIWIVVGSLTITKARAWSKSSKVIEKTAFCGSGILIASVAIDWSYFGEPAFPALKFVYFNVVQSLAVFYGRSRPDYYVTEGLPLLLTTALPFAIWGCWQSLELSRGLSDGPNRTPRFILATAVVATIASLSVIGHKEVRFIYPLLPILHVLGSRPLVSLVSSGSRLRYLVILVLVLVNIIIAGYTSLIHQRGVIDVLHFLRKQQEMRSTISGSANNHGNVTCAFLMPCHSTPWRSHLIYPQINAWALTCEPPLHLSRTERQIYLDEADVFYQDPTLWVQQNMRLQKSDSTAGKRTLPEFVVFFEQLEPELKLAFTNTAYVERWRGFNTHWHDDWRRHGDVIVWQLPASHVGK